MGCLAATEAVGADFLMPSFRTECLGQPRQFSLISDDEGSNSSKEISTGGDERSKMGVSSVSLCKLQHCLVEATRLCLGSHQEFFAHVILWAKKMIPEVFPF